MTYINNYNNNPIQTQKVCSISSVASLPGELTFSLRERPTSDDLFIDRSLPVTIWGDSFRIYQVGDGGYKLRIYEKKNLIAIILFDLLEDSRFDKTIGGSTDVYSEESFYESPVFDDKGNEVEPTPLHPFPAGDLINR